MSGAAFSPWHAWPDAPHIQQSALEETLLGGQAFRWNRINDFWEGRWAQQVVRLRLNAGALEFAIPRAEDPAATLCALRDYFALQTDFATLTDALPHRNDPVLKAAVNAFTGLRILRQPFGETLFCFLCSSTKQIPQIKAICEAVAADFGPQLADGSHALPDWPTIAAGSEARLRQAKLGYRAKYIHQTAVFLAENPGWLETTEAAPTQLARQRLMQLPGVGRKIADCTLLFGAGRLEAFPIDTWVQKILVRAYGLETWSLEQLQHFAHIHFGHSAGYAQQYLFAAARAGVLWD
ncbi:MAG: DNA glycosylase [Verrucomicrobiota bacterium]